MASIMEIENIYHSSALTVTMRHKVATATKTMQTSSICKVYRTEKAAEKMKNGYHTENEYKKKSYVSVFFSTTDKAKCVMS